MDMTVPRLGALARLEPAPEDAVEVRGPSRAWTTADACVLAGLVIAAAAAVGAVAVQSIRTSVIGEDMIRVAVRAGDITEIYQAWQTFARQGVERAVMPDEEQIARQARLAGAIGRMLWAVAAGGLALAAAGTVAVTRRRLDAAS